MPTTIASPHAIDSVRSKLRFAAKFSVNPMYSVFAVDMCGNYLASYVGNDIDSAIESYFAEVFAPVCWGVECRVDGQRVSV